MSVWGVAALGIGSMVGAGIFTLLGEAALMTGRDVYLSFAVGGTIALLSGYSYARLAGRFPGPGGIMEYFDRAFPWRALAGGLSILFLVSLVIALTMISKTFGAYAGRLALGDALTPLAVDALRLGDRDRGGADQHGGLGHGEPRRGVPGRLQAHHPGGADAGGLWALDPTMLAGEPEVPTATLFASVGLTFFAYAGYGIMANASGFVADPARTVPRAIFIAIGVVATLYIGLVGHRAGPRSGRSSASIQAHRGRRGGAPACSARRASSWCRSPRCSPPRRRSTPACFPGWRSPGRWPRAASCRRCSAGGVARGHARAGVAAGARAGAGQPDRSHRHLPHRRRDRADPLPRGVRRALAPARRSRRLAVADRARHRA